MPVVELAESARGPAKTAVVERPTRLVDLCDDIRAPVGFGCRAARCTTCRVEVLEGGSLLSPPGPEEAELLAVVGAPPSVRLACQAVIRGEAGKIVLRWLGPRAPGDEP